VRFRQTLRQFCNKRAELRHGATLPPLAEQHTWMQGFTAVFTVLRLLTPWKMSYEAAKKRAEPYTKIVEELPQMRSEAVQ
jgi:hypothetical protein